MATPDAPSQHAADAAARLPDLFTRFAAVPRSPVGLDPSLVDARRDAWIREWTRIVVK